ncbi:hypothetical protein BGZ72_002370 [Mortierella alpina]|nr:hypothetical protein BGZ72_002370 [Mortierella alpina]
MSPLKSRHTKGLVLAVIIASTMLTAMASGQRDCGKNEFFNDCGSSCPVTCENINNPPAACAWNCVVGCFCEAGLIRRKDGQCVRESECKVSAPVTATVPAPAPTRAPVPAPVQRKCGKNEVFNDCGSSCPATCENINNPPAACTLNCVVGCFCEAGLIRRCFCEAGLIRRKDGQCVRESECKASASVTLTVPTSATRPTSTTASTSAPTLAKPAKKSKKPKKPKCNKYEVYRERNTICERSCKNAESCSRNREAGCFCKENLFRARDGSCVREQSCNKTSTARPRTKTDRKKPKSSRP